MRRNKTTGSARKARRALPLALICALSLCLVSACRWGKDALPKNWMHLSMLDDARTLDPVSAYDHVSLMVMPNVYETLYQYSYLDDPHKIIPLLAADQPTFSKDRLTVKVPLRKGIRFQDDACFPGGKGREVTIEDFIFQFKRLADPKTQSEGYWLFDKRVKGFSEYHDRLKAAETDDERDEALKQPIAGFKALDPYTLEIKLLRPFPQLLYVLALPFTSAVPHEAVDRYKDADGRIDAHPVGSGAFKLKNWDRGFRIELERNGNFHEEFYPTSGHARFREAGMLKDAARLLPFIDGIRFDVLREAQPRWLRFVSGELDMALIPKDEFDAHIQPDGSLKKDLRDKGIVLNKEPSLSVNFILFNMDDPVLGKNKALRQAISSSISREEWIRLFAQGRGLKAQISLPPGVSDRPSKLKLQYDYNLEKAKSLLAKAGYPGGKGLPELAMEMRWADSATRQLGEFIASSLEKIGIRLKVNLNPFPVFLQKQKKGQFQIAQGAWILDYPDPENLYQLLYGPNRSPGANHANFNHPGMNRLYDQMVKMDPGPARAAVIEKMERILQEEVPWALAHGITQYRLTQPRVRNYRESELITNGFKYYRLEE